MTYLGSREVTAIAASAAVWAVLNIWISPIFWQITHLPFLCDILAFTALVFVVWWTRKVGMASLTGLIVTLLTLAFRPGAFHMLGFLAASILFDLTTKAVGYGLLSDRLKGGVVFFFTSLISSALAGFIIGSLFMNIKAVSGILFFMGLHMVGGIMGSVIGVTLINALDVRGIKPSGGREVKP